LAFPEHVAPLAARFTAAGVVGLLTLSYLLQSRFLVALVALDFLLRSIAGPRASPLAALTAYLSRRLRPKQRAVLGRPKQLAALTGTAMLALALIMLGLGYVGSGWLLVGGLTLFAALEASLGFCAVCRLYDVWVGCPTCVGLEPPPL